MNKRKYNKEERKDAMIPPFRLPKDDYQKFMEFLKTKNETASNVLRKAIKNLID